MSFCIPKILTLLKIFLKKYGLIVSKIIFVFFADTLFGKLSLLQRTSQPHGHLLADAIQHAADAASAVMFAIDLLEDIRDLILCQSLAIQSTHQAVTFLILVGKLSNPLMNQTH